MINLNDSEFKFATFIPTETLGQVLKFPKEVWKPEITENESAEYQKVLWYEKEFSLKKVKSIQEVDQLIYDTILMHAPIVTCGSESAVVGEAMAWTFGHPETNVKESEIDNVFVYDDPKNINIPENLYIVGFEDDYHGLSVYWMEKYGQFYVRPFVMPWSYERQNETCRIIIVRVIA